MPADDADDASSTQGRILSAALEVLDRKGPAHVGIRAIAQRAKVSVGLVHHYFTSKDGLLEACVRKLYEALLEVEAEERAGLTEGELGEALAHATRRGYRIACQNRVLVRVVMRIVAERGGLPKTLRGTVQDRFLDGWSRIVSERTQRPMWEVRAQIHTVSSMTGRYAAASKAELASILGEPDLEEEELRRRIEEHLGWLASQVADAPR